MDIGQFAYASGDISGKQYVEVRKRQYGLSSAQQQADGHFSANTLIMQGPSGFRQVPVGDILKQSGCLKSEQELKALLDRFWDWHLQNLEPISDYSLVGGFGRSLYTLQHEKKLVAEFLVSEKISGRCLIQGTDIVVIPEGTSAFYVGMAVAARLNKCTLVTSNGGLVREYLENPCMQAKLSTLQVVSGSFDASTRGIQVEGNDWAKLVNGHRPECTVVVSSVHGISAKFGPCAPSAPAAIARRDLVLSALEKGVRTVIFIADYTKQLDSNSGAFSFPLFGDSKKWYQLLRDHGHRIRIVTAPPAPVCDYIRHDPKERSALRRFIRELRFPDEAELRRKENAEYWDSAHRFLETLSEVHHPGVYHEAVG